MRNSGTRLVAAAGAAYLLGSFPTADLIAKYVACQRGDGRAADLRTEGTGNPGALNAAKVLGTRWGLTILAGDIAKGAAASLAGRRIAGEDGAYVAGIGAVAGHCFPIWSGFRGGKGVATSAGTTIVCFPAYMPFDIALAGASLLLSRGQAGVATNTASGVFAVAATIWHRRGLTNLWGPKPSRWLPIYASTTAAIIAYKFRDAPPLPVEGLAQASPGDGVGQEAAGGA